MYYVIIGLTLYLYLDTQWLTWLVSVYRVDVYYVIIGLALHLYLDTQWLVSAYRADLYSVTDRWVGLVPGHSVVDLGVPCRFAPRGHLGWPCT